MIRQVTSFARRRGLALGLAALLAVGGNSVLASDGANVSHSEPTPAVGTQQACVRVGTTQTGKCTPAPLVAAGTLTVQVIGSSTHPTFVATGVEPGSSPPAECGTNPGVRIDVFGASTGAQVFATVSGPAASQTVSYTTPALDVLSGVVTSAFVCS